MAIQKIQYTNKVDLYTDSSIADINKVVADDMNEIKEVVNNNADEIPVIENTYNASSTNTYSCNYINNSIGKIESGLITTNNMINATIAGSNGKKKSITFTNTYTTPPNVVVCYYNGAPVTYGNINVFVSNITTTGCDLYFDYNISDSKLGVSYIVSGK